ncbi:MAG: hypothetical protein QXP43_04110, partial [Nitrososphaerota archaeon]
MPRSLSPELLIAVVAGAAMVVIGLALVVDGDVVFGDPITQLDDLRHAVAEADPLGFILPEEHRFAVF